MASDFDLPEIDRLLTTTRSVRKRLDFTRKVEREVVLECLGIALQAPSGGNRQPWRWLIVDDADLKNQIAELYRRAHDPYMEMNRAAARESGRTDMEPVIDSSQYLSDHMHEVPTMVIPCMLERLPPGSGVFENASMYGSVLPAVWSFMLALRSRGLGSAYTTLHLANEKEVAEVLGIPETVTQTALIPVAYYKGTDFKPARRKPVVDVVYVNAWKNKLEQ